MHLSWEDLAFYIHSFTICLLRDELCPSQCSPTVFHRRFVAHIPQPARCSVTQFAILHIHCSSDGTEQTVVIISVYLDFIVFPPQHRRLVIFSSGCLIRCDRMPNIKNNKLNYHGICELHNKETGVIKIPLDRPSHNF